MSSMSFGTDSMGRPRQTLMERLGGEPVLANVVKGMYRRIFQDEELKHFFRNADMKRVTSHTYEFLWVLFTEIPDDFDYLNMVRLKHERLFQRGLNENHFDRYINCLVESLHSLGVQRELVNEAAQMLSPLRHVFVEGNMANSGRGY